MSDIEADPPVASLLRCGEHVPALIDQALAIAGHSVRDDVTGSQEREDFDDVGEAAADVAHNRQPGGVTALNRLLQWVQTRITDPVVAHASLDADDELRVGRSDARQYLDVACSGVAVFIVIKSSQPQIGDVDEDASARSRGRRPCGGMQASENLLPSPHRPGS